SSPLLVFLTGAAVCTVMEYITAVFLAKCFGVKCWDYRTYPHTKWCHFQGRVALTISAFFGFAALFVVYLYWDFAAGLAARMGNYIWAVDIALCVLFLADVVYTCAGRLKAKKTGERIKGWAVFSGMEENI
ncbi:MAG: putative ABC transporter permease, partial [Spirochaetaceae bacterium]|nr:putative ABC transporter permease [Spirochaetaceae bacterium]